MEHNQAIITLNMIQERNVYFKALDLTSQLTQLSSLNKMLADVDLFGERELQIKECIKTRKAILSISIAVLHTLEQESSCELLKLCSVDSFGKDVM